MDSSRARLFNGDHLRLADRISAVVEARLGARGRHVVQRFDLLRELVARDIKVRYKRTVAGVLWSLLNPLSQLLVLTFVFRAVLPLDIPQYSSSLFTGLLVWGWFQSAVLISANAIVDGAPLIRQPGFPAAILPAVTVTTQLVHFVFGLPVLIVYLIFQDIGFTRAILLLPVVMGLEFAIALGLGYLVATLHASFRDTHYLLSIILMLLFWVTPVFYDASAIPVRYRLVYLLNPMYHVIESFRAVLLKGQAPPMSSLLVLCCCAAAFLFVGYGVFVKASHRFAEQL